MQTISIRVKVERVVAGDQIRARQVCCAAHRALSASLKTGRRFRLILLTVQFIGENPDYIFQSPPSQFVE